MTIKKIHIIQDFGIFKDFNWNRDNTLQDFREKNVIYGWNYSGKTTLSRIFSSLRDKELHQDYTNAYFKIVFDDGSELESNNLENVTQKVTVFNKEYIESNLFWDEKSKNQVGEPIAFDVGENVTIRSEIEGLDEKMTKVIERKESHQPAINSFNEFDNSKFTARSKIISSLVFGAERQFTKRNFTIIQNRLTEEYENYIITDETEVEKLQKASQATNSFEKKIALDFSSSYASLHSKVEELLKEEPTKDVIIDKLEKNKPLYDWVKIGFDLEDNKDECAFCGNDVTEDRITLLNNYFSNASKELRDKIEELRQEIENEIISINNLSIPTSKLEFVEKIQDDVSVKITEFITVKTNYLATLNELKEELVKKEDGNIFKNIPIKIVESKENLLTEWIENLKKLIETHNSSIDNFDTERDAARETFSNHLVASYLNDENYIEKEKNKSKAAIIIERFNVVFKKYENKKTEKVNSLKTITKGKDELDEFIKKFLNREDIKIGVTDEDKFILLRGEHPASNLSEGEKTAIAFSYFLVFLESLGVDVLKETIVYIDDPISSLDNNHIAQVYSLINSFFFRKGLNPDDENQVIDCFEQLFISTHNFEFFSFLKDSKRIKKNCGYYFIKKIDIENSTFLNLPKSLSRYKSEYIYLFELIYKYNEAINNGDDNDDLLMPNALRRFLEIYTLMKIPNEPESVESRINELVDDVNQFKLLNHFSHFTTFEKLTKHDELIMILPDACKELFKLLEEDTTHYVALKKSIGVN